MSDHEKAHDTDVLARTRAVLEGLPEGRWWDVENGYIAIEVNGCTCGGPIEHYGHQPGCGSEPLLSNVPLEVAPFIAKSRQLLPELADELEELRKGGAWVEHVERQRAMKRERDGECICNTGPDTDGPDEFCPWHGRPYSELVAEVVRLHSWDGLMSLLDEHYPADIFPTLPDDPKRDAGPRIVSLIRELESQRSQVGAVRRLIDEQRIPDDHAWAQTRNSAIRAALDGPQDGGR